VTRTGLTDLVELLISDSVSSTKKASKHQFKRQQLGREWNAESILSVLNRTGSDTEGPQLTISGITSLDLADDHDLTFCSVDGAIGAHHVTKSNAAMIFCPKSLKGKITPKSNCQLLFLDNPRLDFVRFANLAASSAAQYNQSHPIRKAAELISNTAVIDKTAEIGVNCHIGDFVKIGPNCVLGDNITIGDRATLVQNCILGDNVIVQPGVTLGADGFAYERHEDGSLEKFPHFAGVRIGNNVEICSNCSIARGSLTDTVIGDSTKIDALVHIAHNVQVGRYCQLTAGTVIGGSTQLGDYCWTGLNSTIKNKIKIGNNVLVAAGACVIANVANDDIVAGVPARSIRQKVSTKDLSIMVDRKSVQS
jgi:UDP-3-O-[3-hydroxymyristoyl] glucosamine N-acyltransferase LpxD